MKLEEYLGIWQKTSSGASIPLDYGLLCREIAKLALDIPAYQIIEQMEAEQYIETLSNGNRKLTELGMQKRVPIPMRPVAKPEGNEAAWDKFRRVCHYYSDCVKQSEKVQEYLFEDGLNNRFLLPLLEIDWWKHVKPFRLATSPTQRPAINRIKARRDDDEDVLIGYPLSAFKTSNGALALTPIFLIPVDVTFDLQGVSLLIRHDEIDINRTWLEFSIRKEEHKACLEGICFTEGDNLGLINLEVALQYLANRFQVKLEPNNLHPVIEGSGIINTAALFIGTGLKFSKTLKNELMMIADQPAAVLDKTALAYVFRNPPLENSYEHDISRIPLEFLQSNSEQNKALIEALNKPASKVTGPPGTGKSQVAVNIIANLVYDGKSVLFTSKNHKAIHAIVDKSKDATPRVNLVQFCTTQDDSGGATWYKQDLEEELGTFAELLNGLAGQGALAIQKTEDGIDDLRDCQTEISRVEHVRSAMQDINRQLEVLGKEIEIPLDHLTDDFRTHLEKLTRKLYDVSLQRSFLKRLVDALLRRKRHSQNAEEELRKILPTIAGRFNSAATVKKRVEALCGKMTNYLETKELIAEIIEEAKKLPDYQALLNHLANAYSETRQNMQDAFIAKRSKYVSEMPSEAKQNLQNATRMIARQNLPFLSQVISQDVINEAQNAFVQFSRYFPAWACTLLSLTKASPCVAGLFDKVIIDEASQCEIPPMIPALYRARGLTIIGDPAQFPPVITMRENRHAFIRFISHKLTEVEDERYDFITHNAYDMLNVTPVFLCEHYRCNADIVGYFNAEYYSGKLKVCTNPFKLEFPSNMGFRHGLEWRNVADSLEAEIAEVESLLTDLANNNYKGSIGVITPFRKLASDLQVRLAGISRRLEVFDVSKDVSTANGFQGGERDLIIFVLGMTSQMTHGQGWYASSPENRYIYNVAASRARACLIIVGDRERAATSELSALRNLAKPHRPRPSLSESPGEAKLYAALCHAGYAPVQQYPLAGRYLDMALVDNKIDIEVDGEAFHLNRYGERKSDDVYRDMVVQSTGWRVIRFWYYQVINDVDGCVNQVGKLLSTNS